MKLAELKPQLADIAIAFSLANLIWCYPLQLLQRFFEGNQFYFLGAPPPLKLPAAALASLLVLWLLLTIGVRVAWLVPFLFVLSLSRFLYALTYGTFAYPAITQFVTDFAPLHNVWLRGAAAAAFLGIVAVPGSRLFLIRAIRAICLLVLPFAGFQTGRSVSMAFSAPGATLFADRSSVPLPAAAPHHPRIVWIVFDEMDQRLTSANKPEGVRMPAWDRLRSQSIVASRAVPPFNRTVVSIPALLTGRRFTDATPAGPTDLLLESPDSPQRVSWSELPTVFTRARELGWTSGVVGWYHPYGRILGSQLNFCRWLPTSQAFIGIAYVQSLDILPATAALWSQQFDTSRSAVVPGRTFTRFDLTASDFARADHARLTFALHSQALAALRNPNLHLLFLHYSIPHAPGIWDREADRESLSRTRNYADNLVLVDHYLTDIIKTVDEMQSEAPVTLIISSDHPHHTTWTDTTFVTAEDARMQSSPFSPFLVHFPGQIQSFEHPKLFPTLSTHDLILALIRGEIATPSQLLAWMASRELPNQTSNQTPVHQ